MLIPFEGSEKPLRSIILDGLYAITAFASGEAFYLLHRRRSRTTGAATGAIGVMARLIVGVTVRTGI